MEDDTELELDELVGAVEEELELMFELDDEDDVPELVALENKLDTVEEAELRKLDVADELELLLSDNEELKVLELAEEDEVEIGDVVGTDDDELEIELAVEDIIIDNEDELGVL